MSSRSRSRDLVPIHTFAGELFIALGLATAWSGLGPSRSEEKTIYNLIILCPNNSGDDSRQLIKAIVRRQFSEVFFCGLYKRWLTSVVPAIWHWFRAPKSRDGSTALHESHYSPLKFSINTSVETNSHDRSATALIITWREINAHISNKVSTTRIDKNSKQDLDRRPKSTRWK